MKQIQINLFEGAPETTKNNATPQTTKKRPFLLTKPGILVLSCFLFVTATSTLSYHYSKSADSALNKTIGFLGQIKQFAENRDKELLGEKDGRINILLLGMGGKYHEGSYLTDTIMIASLQPETKEVALISLPRDLQVNIPGYGYRKINNANAFGEMKEEGKGPELARQVIEETFDMDIHYYIRIDFTGFEEIVDALGGIDVMVQNSFTDYQYPTSDKKYQVVSFKAGPQTMDGETALKYARSRHSGMNGEGSDFARSKRQQKILMGVKEKILTADFFLNPTKISEVTNSLEQNLTTDFKSWELARLATLTRDVNLNNIHTVVFDDGVNGYLYSDIINEAYVLVPRGNNFDAMTQRIDTIFEEKNESITELPPKPSIGAAYTYASSAYDEDETEIDMPQNPKNLPDTEEQENKGDTIIVKNGTSIPGLAAETADLLEAKGFTISYIGNASEKGWTETTIYDFTKGEKIESLDKLSRTLGADIVTGNSPEKDANNAGVDFLIVLGE